MNMQGVYDPRRLHRQVGVLGAVLVANKFQGTIERKIEVSEMGLMQQESTSGCTDRAAQNVLRTSVGDNHASIVIFLSGEG